MVLKNDQGVLIIVDSTVFIVSYRNIKKTKGFKITDTLLNEIREKYYKFDNWSNKSFV